MKAIVEEISKSHTSSPVVLKGGTALLLAYKLDRNSVDLDFDIEKGSEADFASDIERAAKNLGYTNCQVNIKKSTDTTKRYMLHNVDGNGASPSPLKIEFSARRDVIPEHEYSLIDGFSVYNIGVLATQKTQALIGRNMPRDLYDVNFILTEYRDEIPRSTAEQLISHIEQHGLDTLLSEFGVNAADDEILRNIDVTTLGVQLIENLDKLKDAQSRHSVDIDTQKKEGLKDQVIKHKSVPKRTKSRNTDWER